MPHLHQIPILSYIQIYSSTFFLRRYDFSELHILLRHSLTQAVKSGSEDACQRALRDRNLWDGESLRFTSLFLSQNHDDDDWWIELIWVDLTWFDGIDLIWVDLMRLIWFELINFDLIWLDLIGLIDWLMMSYILWCMDFAKVVTFSSFQGFRPARSPKWRWIRRIPRAWAPWCTLQRWDRCRSLGWQNPPADTGGWETPFFISFHIIFFDMILSRSQKTKWCQVKLSMTRSPAPLRWDSKILGGAGRSNLRQRWRGRNVLDESLLLGITIGPAAFKSCWVAISWGFDHHL